MPQVCPPCRSRILAVKVMSMVVWLCGCHPTLYNARSLPPEYAAAPAVDIQSLDLSRLALPEANSQIVHEGDVLGVSVVTGAAEETPETWALRVASDGMVNVPLVGAVPVAGHSLFEAEHAIRNASIERGIFRQPTVAATLQTRRSNRVTVMGAVHKPGTYELPVTSSDLLSALLAAGGLTEQADRTIEIQNPPPTRHPPPRSHVASPGSASLASYSVAAESGGARIIPVDLVQATNTKDTRDLRLRDGSVVMVTPRAAQYVHVMGLVNRPNQFALPQDREMRVLDAIARAGGLSISIANKVYVIRKAPGTGQSIVIKISLRKAKKNHEENIPLAAGDVISVEETPDTFLVGMLRQLFSVGVSSRVPF